MDQLELSIKGRKLIKLYEEMAIDGYKRKDGSFIDKKDNKSSAFSDFEIRRFQELLLPYFIANIPKPRHPKNHNN